VKITLPANSIVTLHSGPDLPQVQASSGGPLPGRHGLEDASDERLNRAAIEGDVGDVREFLSQGDDVNDTLPHGYSALHGAAASPYAGAVDVINELLKAGARTSQATTEGLTPLHFAAMNVWTRGETTEGPLAGDKIRALIAGGADENATDNRGRTPLHWAAMMAKLSDIEVPAYDAVVIDALLDGGASVNAKDERGFTPLDYAVREGNTAAASELKRRGGVHGEGEPETPPPPPPPGDTSRPTVSFTAVSPDPRDAAVDTISLTFSEPVNGVGIDDFRLTRDGRNVMPSGAALVRVNGSTYRVTGLAAATGIAGSYMLKLDRAIAGITDEAGNPLLASASENWTMSGGVGATPRQTVLGTNGKDLIVVRESNGSVIVDVNGTENAIDAGTGELLIDALDGDDRIIVEVDAPRKLLITGSTGRDTINGGPGAEELSGGVGMDRIYAGDGNDFLIGGGHNDYLNGQAGDDLVLGSGGNDRLYAGGGNDWLIGMLGNDVLFGNPGTADTASGNEGDDTLVDADDGTSGSSDLDTIAGIETFIRTT
jgi:ankyrin repeat protein